MAKERTGIIVGLNKGHLAVDGFMGRLGSVDERQMAWDGYMKGMKIFTGELGIPVDVHTFDRSPKMPNYESTHMLLDSKKIKTTPIETKARISRSKGRLSRRTAFVRDIVKEVAGLAPYERRVVELLRNSQDKRARKLAKKRLGTIGRAKAKVDEMQKVIAEARRAGH
ncbi:hypothetical protein UA08_02809 [Talaromyces atroroseus]|uniref:60S ribosomal protein L36 n=1 Tax=Talaromyces atroroseus TaxID=1441469 RepID=A0A225AY48_TALAT|nr:hypothetical protein UA08_02809 [Talaromyces atroroseus]OKL62258.1 hypothetical protein UA08_02809 [Talaromyces atroroseus]